MLFIFMSFWCTLALASSAPNSHFIYSRFFSIISSLFPQCISCLFLYIVVYFLLCTKYLPSFPLEWFTLSSVTSFSSPQSRRIVFSIFINLCKCIFKSLLYSTVIAEMPIGRHEYLHWRC